MKAASDHLEFEVAAVCRDQLSAVESIREGQRVVAVSDTDQDVLGLYREGDLVELSVMLVRAGRVIDVASFSNRRVEVPDDEVVATFLREHYGDGGSGEALIPEEIIVPVLPDGADGVAEWLAERRAALAQGRQKKCEILAPVRGPRKALLDMAVDNARHAFEEKRRAATDIDERLARVQERLRLPTLPRRIECCDISHLGGQDTVGAVVALFNGQPDKKKYRTYKVRSVGEGDDYRAMFEVLSRRFRRGRDAAQIAAAENPEPETVTPDGSLPESPGVDGHASATEGVTSLRRRGTMTSSLEAPMPDAADGRRRPDRPRALRTAPPIRTLTPAPTQRRVRLDWRGARPVRGRWWARAARRGARRRARSRLAPDLPICGLSKEKENVAGDKLVDRVYLPGQKNPIPLRPNSPELFLLARARDEAHRFSNRGRKKVGKKRRLSSELDQIPGVGQKTRVALLKELGLLGGRAQRQRGRGDLGRARREQGKHLAALREWFERAATTPSE